jgi:hypothetical protein
MIPELKNHIYHESTGNGFQANRGGVLREPLQPNAAANYAQIHEHTQ